MKNIKDKNYDWSETYPLVSVSYTDHAWLKSRDLNKLTKQGKPQIVTECGLLLVNKKSYLVLCKLWAFNEETQQQEFCDSTVIMKANLTQPIKFLEKRK